MMSKVRISEDALYWGVANEVGCTFGLASDPESGIEYYDVTITQPEATCGEVDPTYWPGRPRALKAEHLR